MTVWTTPKQQHTSAETSINQNRLPVTFKVVQCKLNGFSGVNLDLGGGKFDNVQAWMDNSGISCQNLVYDPFNRTPEHNTKVLTTIIMHGTDSVTINNVLNVIKEAHNRQQVLRQAWDALKKGGNLYICIYEGNKSGEGKSTSKGYQLNKKIQDYLTEIRSIFPNAIKKHGLIVASKEG